MPQQNPATVLLTGASGFIGRTLFTALSQAGFRVYRALSPRHAQGQEDCLRVDFARDTSAEIWRERLSGVDAVINAVGVLRDSRSRPIDALHGETPKALFTACAQAGVKRVIQISALGIEGSSTRYASSKRAADSHLLELVQQGKLSAAVLRPSIVFGKGGASSALFMNLARLPLLCLPQPVLQARVQPLAVSDLAQAVRALLQEAAHEQGVLELAGPEAIHLGNFIASLRQQSGHKPARVLRLPDWLTRFSARLGDCVPVSPWCSESLALLAKDNVADAACLRRLLGRDAVHYSALVAQEWQQA